MRVLSPGIALCVVFLASWGLFVLAGKIQARHTVEEDKETAYFCGEVYRPSNKKAQKGEMNPEYRRFFAVAFLFTIMEIGALVLGTIPKGMGIWLPLGFLGLMILSVGAILVEVFGAR